jgi:hypothetical protein
VLTTASGYGRAARTDGRRGGPGRRVGGRRLALLASALATLGGASRAGGTPPTIPRANASDISYCPPERLAFGPAAPEQHLNVFLPVGTAPAGGWPVVLTTGYGGGDAILPRAQLTNSGTTQRFWQFVDSGMAVVDFGATAVGGGAGLWYPQGHPSGGYESFHPSDDNPEKEAEWAIQWVKTQAQFALDPTRVGTWGRSGGATILLRATMGPDGARASGSAQVRASTRVRAVVGLQPPTSVWAFDQGPSLGISLPEHLERAAQPGVAASALGEVSEDLQKDYSLMRACFENPVERANNSAQPVCLIYGEPMTLVGGQPVDLSLDAQGFPVLHDLFVPPAQHDQWFGQVLWRRLIGLSGASAAFHAERSVFAVRDIHALPAPNDVHTHTFPGNFVGPAATALVHDWLVAELVPPAGGIQDAGFEAQTAGALPGAPWTVLAGTAHRVRSGSDQGMPSEGSQWLELAANGTSGATPPSNPGGAGTPALGGAGVAQTFRFPRGLPVLKFDAAFLLSGPAATASINDWASIDIGDGTTWHNVYLRDGFSPLPLTSALHGLPMTGVETVAVDLGARFPAATEDTLFTLVLQVGNGGNGILPSKLYVDRLRFGPAGARVEVFPCDPNPAGSFSVWSGLPSLGSQVTFGVADPTGTLAAGSLPLVLRSFERQPHACGVSLPGYGLGGPGAWILWREPGVLHSLAGPPWPGPGRPSQVSLPVPNLPALLGASLYVQGLLIDRSQPPRIRLGLTEGRELVLGP